MPDRHFKVSPLVFRSLPIFGWRIVGEPLNQTGIMPIIGNPSRTILILIFINHLHTLLSIAFALARYAHRLASFQSTLYSNRAKLSTPILASAGNVHR